LPKQLQLQCSQISSYLTSLMCSAVVSRIEADCWL
jgi:hypothetical protein